VAVTDKSDLGVSHDFVAVQMLQLRLLGSLPLANKKERVSEDRNLFALQKQKAVLRLRFAVSIGRGITSEFLRPKQHGHELQASP
jgi:hypothetical protein